MADPVVIQIPGTAVSEKDDLRLPVRSVLEDLDLLGSHQETKDADGVMAVFTGPPQSVALIEAGATAASKWWATGLGATVLATWGTVTAWWGDQEPNLKLVVVAGAALVTAALVWSIAYLIASDVRGRAAAAVATVNARVSVAEAMIAAAERAARKAPSSRSGVDGSTEQRMQLIPLATGVRVENLAQASTDEEGWRALAMERHADGKLKYIVVKDSRQVTVPAEQVTFV